nr:uncharacterized protein LOC115262436 [Aedes albopictus]
MPERWVGAAGEFTQNFHMEEEHFEELFQKVKHRLEPKRCTRPDGISPKHRLAYTLEYLAGGPFFERYAASNYRISKASSCHIIRETCQIIYEELAKTEFMAYTKENWSTVADDFEQKWNMPNCLGSLDGKHVRIKCPSNAGSLYYNYKVRYIFFNAMFSFINGRELNHLGITRGIINSSYPYLKVF